MMPDEKYNFKPTDGSLSFAENLMHIGFAMNWHSQSLLGGKPAIKWADDTRYKVSNRTKDEMIAIVDKTFEEATKLMEQFDTSQFEDTLDYFGLTRTKLQIFMLLADHITHHRGQMLVYLRLNGLVPPRYVLFQ